MENICLLEEENMNIDFNNNCCTKFSININLDYLRRVFDNVFSNIKKYSKKGNEIIINLYEENNHICIEFINHCIEKTKEIESNKIGLKSSQKLMENMKGTLEYLERDDIFITKIKIPII